MMNFFLHIADRIIVVVKSRDYDYRRTWMHTSIGSKEDTFWKTVTWNSKKGEK
jgi:hypothetical protein